MDKNKNGIAILSDQKVRANIIQNLIKKGLNGTVSVSVFGSNELENRIQSLHKLILFVDLISVEKPAGALIRQIRNMFPGTKIIALHIYRSHALTQPLFDIGINGYVYYEPTQNELVQAIHSVEKGETYAPEYLNNP